MSPQTVTVELTPLQLSHTIVALQDHMKALLQASAVEPEGGEHEDYLVAQSILKRLAEAQAGLQRR